VLVFTSFVITGFPLPEDSLRTSSETYCKIQDTRPVLFHSTTSFLYQCIHCLLNPSSSVVQGPASPPLYWFEDLYPPLWLIVGSVQQGQATQETVSDSQYRVVSWRRSRRRVALTILKIDALQLNPQGVMSWMMPTYYSLGTRGVVFEGWFRVRGRGGVWEGLRLGEQWL